MLNTDRLKKRSLKPNQCIQSANRAYQFCYQNDGNAAVYCSYVEGPIWDISKFDSNPGKIEMQSDGNLVGKYVLACDIIGNERGIFHVEFYFNACSI